MDPWWFKNAALLYKLLLAAGFLGVATWKTLCPRQIPTVPVTKRWTINGLLLLLTDLTGSLLFRVGAVALAVAVSDSKYGLLNREIVPFSLRAALGFLLLDLTRYGIHLLCHRVPMLWRIHQVHHADADFDVSTGVRFHPAEVIFSQGCFLLVVALFAPPPSVVLCYELYYIVNAFFAHANLRLPARLEKWLRLVHVTPELHRIHHCIDASDQESNFASIFSFWDRLFGTYRNCSKTGAEQLVFGLDGVTGSHSIRLTEMLALPFSKSPSASRTMSAKKLADDGLSSSGMAG